MTYLNILEKIGDDWGTTRADDKITATLASRVTDENPNHHLWNNRGTWWCHFTLHRSDFTAERIRVSLKTSDLELARRRRDNLLQSFSTVS